MDKKVRGEVMAIDKEIPDGYGYAACQICGKPVLVKLPFVGCVFCRDCILDSDSWAWQANTDDFKQPFTVEMK